MNEELLVSLAEAMLNEGIDEDSIISVLSNLVEEQEEVLPVSESCFNSIVGLTEAIINELLAPNNERAKAVFDRKTQQLDANTQASNVATKRYGEFIENLDTFHKRNPKATTQDRYNTMNLLHGKANEINGNQGEKLSNGAKRLNHWAAKNKNKISPKTLDSARAMTKAGQENDWVRQHNNADIG